MTFKGNTTCGFGGGIGSGQGCSRKRVTSR
ncbi:hypothetical protein CpMRi49_00405 [Corynebacterium ulcerans]|nr:hypothetical protein CpMRi49_00405 [Corynebacterium ulcerans]